MDTINFRVSGEELITLVQQLAVALLFCFALGTVPISMGEAADGLS